MLSSPTGSSTFTSDEDPRLIADSMPLALKIYEVILANDPENANLAAATGRNFVLYSGAFIHTPADMLPDDEWEKTVAAKKRAKLLYRRGRDYLIEALELKHKGFRKLLSDDKYDEAILMLEEEDAETAHWAGLGWLGMIAVAPLDLDLLNSLDMATLLLYRSMELKEDRAGIHEIMIQLQSSLPSFVLARMREKSPHIRGFMDNYYKRESVSDSLEARAGHHYSQAVALSDNSLPGPHITMAKALAVKNQDVEAFKSYLNMALDIDPDKNPESRVQVLIFQDKARWLLGNIENYFITSF